MRVSIAIGSIWAILAGAACSGTRGAGPPADPPAISASPVPELTVEFNDADSYAFTAEDRRTITGIAEASVAELVPLLDGIPDSVRLVVQATDQVIPETGDGGVALAPGQISWSVDPGREGGVQRIARARLRTTLFHEMHHLVRGWTVQGGTAGRRLIDAAVSEGLATAFERDAGGWAPPWANYPEDSIRDWVVELQNPPEGATYPAYMFQHPDGRRWIGYRAGTYIVEQAMMASGRTAAGLARVPTDQILTMAGF